MYCSICGASIPAHRASCDTCGGPASAPARPLPDLGSGGVGRHGGGPTLAVIGLCPRCNFSGEGLPYFSRGSHIAALAGLTLFTFPLAFGAAGFLYWALRKDHRICPRCGSNWGKDGERGFLPVAVRRGDPAPARKTLPSESSRRGWSILFFIVAAIFLIGGMTAPDAAASAFGLAFGAGGFALHRSANRVREQRRQALLASLQTQVVRLARERRGMLTVTEAAAALEWPIRRAEKVLHSLDDGLRVDSEVTDEGVIVYHFRELLLGRDGEGDSLTT